MYYYKELISNAVMWHDKQMSPRQSSDWKGLFIIRTLESSATKKRKLKTYAEIHYFSKNNILYEIYCPLAGGLA